MKGFEEDGVWFLPDAQDREIFGRLTFSPDKPPKLYLFGQLQDILERLQEIDVEGKIQTDIKFPIIHGYLVTGEQVTLCESFQPFNFKTGIPTSEIYPSYILRGHHFKSFDDITLHGISVKYTFLEDWVDISNFKIEYKMNPDNTQVQELKVKQEILEPIELGKLSNFSIFIRGQQPNVQNIELIKFFGKKFKEVNLKINNSIVIRSDEKRSLKDFIYVINLIQDLLIFASGQMIYPYEIRTSIITIEKEKIIPEDIRMSIILGLIQPEKVAKSSLGFELHQFGDEIKAIEEEKEKLIPIDIYYQVSESKIEENELDRRKVLFYFDDIKDMSSEILEYWELNRVKIEPILDLYLRLTYIPRRHINDFFLSMAQAIEAFHRTSHDGIYIDEKTYKNVVIPALSDSIPSKLSDYSLPEFPIFQEMIANFIKSMKKKLTYLNEYSLKERLEDLINVYQECIPDRFFQTEDEKNSFSKQVRDTRGSLTHLSSNSDNKQSDSRYVVKGQELFNLSKKLKILLEICLVKQLGFEDSKIKSIFTRKL
ncbi:HEPN domain-containing protein [Nostoc sp. CALU 546]|uniref:ApeA N-terminal domain 1-containing protein n=1 Tax=Nostoc sp. CALU 546 TaxID=1867241 RepID=UPI003B6767A8